MENVDIALQSLKQIESDFKTFCSEFGGASEADTRV